MIVECDKLIKCLKDYKKLNKEIKSLNVFKNTKILLFFGTLLTDRYW